MLIGIKTDNNGGCGECACECHDDSIEMPAPHIAMCKFADLDYCPPDFHEKAREAAKGMQYELDKIVRDNAKGPS